MTTETRIRLDLGHQRLWLTAGGRNLLDWPISSSAKGGGECRDSGCTPRGLHRIRLRIGAGCAPNTVFVGRRPTGEIYTPELGRRFPGRDWILTRILWLTGLESGVNRGGEVDTLRRFVYIHGCPDTTSLGVPGSHGCIRMRNRDLLTLFERVEAGTLVEIRDHLESRSADEP